LNCNNISIIEHLPDTIQELELSKRFNLELDNLPSSIKKIIFDKYSPYNKKLNCLPNGLTILKLPTHYKHRIQNIPGGINKNNMFI